MLARFKCHSALVSFYFTTAGFFTEATIEFKDGKMVAHEVVRVDGMLLATGSETRVWGRYENGPGSPMKGQTISEELKALFRAR